MSRIRLGVIADDVTGATDLASLVARSGWRVVQVFGPPTPDQEVPEADVVVVALKSRSIPSEDAVTQSIAAAQALLALGAEQLYFKYCSTFDSTKLGNIGPVLDALTSLSHPDAAVVVSPTTPVNHRTVYQGHLFVSDVLLENSPLRHHPINPMTKSDVRVLLDEQASGSTGLVALPTVEEGSEAIAQALTDLREQGHTYAVVDGVREDDLDGLAKAVAQAPLVSGAGGLAGAMGRQWGVPEHHREQVRIPSGRAGIVSGSCSARTQEQVAAYSKEHPSLYIDLLRAASGTDVVEEAKDFVRSTPQDQAPLLYTTADDETVKRIQAELGVDRAAELGERINGDLAAMLVDEGCQRLVLAGGETSGAAVDRLKVDAITIGPEVAAGVPWVVTNHAAPLGLVLKSGNFGDADMFSTALSMTEQEG